MTATLDSGDVLGERGWFAALGRLVVRRRRLVLVLFALGVVVAAVFGSQLFGALKTAGYDDPTSESAAANTALIEQFGVVTPVIALAVEVAAGIDDPAGSAAAVELVQQLEAEPGVSSVVSYWTSGRPDPLRGSDGLTGQVLVYTAGTTEAEQAELAQDIVATYGGTNGGLVVYVGGFATVSAAITESITTDLARAESIAIPLTLVLLLVVFGGAVASGLPFLVAAGAILGSFFVMWLITLTTDVSVFSLNLITGLALGLGIDYALLVVNRFREELAAGYQSEVAVVRTVASAGRTVAVSGITVAIVLAGLLFFPQYFLRSFGYAGIAVALLAVLTTITALPALLAVLGPKVDRLKVRRGNLAPRDEGVWSHVAHFVMRRPWPVLLGVTGLLLVLAAPALSVAFNQVDARVLPADNPAVIASVVLAERFPGQEASPIEIVLPGLADNPEAITAYATEISELPGVTRVTTPTAVVAGGEVVGPNPQPQSYVEGDDARVSVISDIPPITREASALVSDIRAVPAPTPDRLVGGAAAQFTDSQAATGSHGIWALAWVIIATLIVLFLYTGSVLLPIKAVALNVLSLGATLGVIVWVFQDGNLMWLVGDFTLTGGIDTSIVVLIAVVAFALSMDYEIFLLSRIKEEHDAGRDTTDAVALGLQRSGRIITAAALLLAIVFASFITSGVTSIKQLGLGVAFAILLDATIVRGLLVPALMRVAGSWNWWAPRPLVALHQRIGLSER